MNARCVLERNKNRLVRDRVCSQYCWTMYPTEGHSHPTNHPVISVEDDIAYVNQEPISTLVDR
jgi:hypothetical protein